MLYTERNRACHPSPGRTAACATVQHTLLHNARLRARIPVTAQLARARKHPQKVEAMGYLNRSDINTLWDYQRRTGVRGVKFGAWCARDGAGRRKAPWGAFQASARMQY
jgi:hypothetical protein